MLMELRELFELKKQKKITPLFFDERVKQIYIKYYGERDKRVC